MTIAEDRYPLLPPDTPTAEQGLRVRLRMAYHAVIVDVGHQRGEQCERCELSTRQYKVSPTVPSWNQLLGWLREIDLLRKAQAA